MAAEGAAYSRSALLGRVVAVFTARKPLPLAPRKANEAAHCSRRTMASAEGAAPHGTVGRLFQGVSRQEFGFKMLQSMGWSEGQARSGRARAAAALRVLTPRHAQGLGASGTGITKHIAAVRRQDQIGAFACTRGVAALRSTTSLQVLAPISRATAAPKSSGPQTCRTSTKFWLVRLSVQRVAYAALKCG